MAKRKPPSGPERTEAGEPVWVMEGMTGMQVVGIAADRLYLTEDDEVGKAMKRGASVADALADAAVQFPLGKVERVWFVGNRSSLRFRWGTKGGPKEATLLCEPAVRDEIMDELERALGRDFVRDERKLKPGEVIALPLGCLGVAVVLAAVLAFAWGGTAGFATAGGLVLMALLYVVVVLVMPETATELVPAD